MNTIALKDARVEIKTSKALKERLNAAASLIGQDLTAFMLASAESRAQKILSEHNALQLSHDEQANFMQVMKTPAKSTKALKEMMSMEPLIER